MGKRHCCPICSGNMRFNPWHPTAVCSKCYGKVTSADGRPLDFYRVDNFGDLVGRYADTGEPYPTLECFINGVRCGACEGRFGGDLIVVASAVMATGKPWWKFW